MKILIIEEEKRLANFIKHGLEEEKYSVDIALDSTKGYEMALNNNYIAFIIDISLMGISGINLLKEFRFANINSPIIILSEKYETEDIVEVLDNGADDIIAKPFSFEELAARLRAVIRRTTPEVTTKLKCGDLVLNTITHIAYRNGEEIDLTTKEYALLEYLMKNKNRVLTRANITQNVWKQSVDNDSNIIDVYIKRIRNKTEIKGSKRPLVQSIRGVGYRIRDISGSDNE